eukprot:m.35594 g.35594  ORF g.35594 m.35594 type:complete len:77 (-) comp12404_c0_seq2:113-343(-)
MWSFHSHSGQFCKHAAGTLEEMVLQAIKLGFTHYGLSEHMPRYRGIDLYPEELEAHCFLIPWFSIDEKEFSHPLYG